MLINKTNVAVNELAAQPRFLGVFGQIS